MWLVLDLDRWSNYSKFTLRLSWPASSPASFFVQIYTPESLLNRLSDFQHTPSSDANNYVARDKTSRRMYAHIRVVDETDGMSTVESTQRVVFRVILEPLIMGVLPASVQPVVVALVLVASLAALAVPWINRYFERLAWKARAEATLIKKQ
jgi:hypothetical protein